VAAALIVKEVVEGIALTVVPDAIPEPLTTIPTTMPVVEATVSVGEPVGGFEAADAVVVI